MATRGRLQSIMLVLFSLSFYTGLFKGAHTLPAWAYLRSAGLCTASIGGDSSTVESSGSHPVHGRVLFESVARCKATLSMIPLFWEPSHKGVKEEVPPPVEGMASRGHVKGSVAIQAMHWDNVLVAEVSLLIPSGLIMCGIDGGLTYREGREGQGEVGRMES